MTRPTLELVARPPLDARMPLVLWLAREPGTARGLLGSRGRPGLAGVLSTFLTASAISSRCRSPACSRASSCGGGELGPRRRQSCPAPAGTRPHRLHHAAQQLLLAQRIVVVGLKAWGVLANVGGRQEGTLLLDLQKADGASLLGPETLSRAPGSERPFPFGSTQGPIDCPWSPYSFWFPRSTHFIFYSPRPPPPGPTHLLVPGARPHPPFPRLLCPRGSSLTLALWLTDCQGAEVGPLSWEDPRGSGPAPGGQR